MVFSIDKAHSRPHPPCLLTNVNKKMFFFIEGFPYKYVHIVIIINQRDTMKNHFLVENIWLAPAREFYPGPSGTTFV